MGGVDPASGAVALPRFVVECPVLPGDERALIEVAAFPPGRVLGDTVVSVLAWPKGQLGKTYTRSAKAAAAAKESNTNKAILLAINGVRRDAGQRPVGLATKESEVALAAARHFWAALSGRDDADPTLADKILLGLRAGWDVEGVVRQGSFAEAASEGDQAASLIESALERPNGRETLLAPEAELLAVGVVRTEDHRWQAGVHERKEGEPWGNYVVLVIVASPSTTASLDELGLPRG